MRIAIFHELPMGGARRVANEFSLELKKRHIVDGYIVDTSQREGEKLYYSNIFNFKFLSKEWSGGNWKVKLYKDTIELWKLYKLHKSIANKINSKKYDIVIVHPSKYTQSPFILRFIKGKKIYYAEEVYRIIYEKYFESKPSGNIFKDLYECVGRFIKKQIDIKNVSSAEKIIVSSKNTANNFRKFYKRKVSLFYPGINTNFFSPGSNKKDTDVLFVGSVSNNTDGYFDLQKATKNISNIKIGVIGDGKKWLTDNQIRNYYRRSRIVFCGAHNEPLGLVPLEAASCGVPVVAVNDGGYKETIVDGKTGYFVKRNHKDIERKIKYLLKNKDVLEIMSLNARKNSLKNWKMDYLSKKFEKMLLEICTKI